MNNFIYLPDVVTLSLCEQTCNGCGMCVKVCPHEVFELTGKKAHIVRKDHCMECGACAMNCQTGAVTVKSGVGCAAGVINGLLRGTEPTCDCSKSSNCC